MGLLVVSRSFSNERSAALPGREKMMMGNAEKDYMTDGCNLQVK